MGNVLTKINGKYDLYLPEHRAARPEWKIENGGWEVERIEAMLRTIKRSDIVFDIGTEEGDISALIQKYTGCMMVLCEPNPLVWPCIKEIWRANNLEEPIDFYGGFFSDKHESVVSDYDHISFHEIEGEIIPDHGFAALSDSRPDIPQLSLDTYCEIIGVYPTVITMDVEGSEHHVIRGAVNTLKKHRPHIFMSLHPEFSYESYRNTGIWEEMYGERQYAVHLLRFIDELGYKHRVIEYDYHELHIEFIPQ